MLRSARRERMGVSNACADASHFFLSSRPSSRSPPVPRRPRPKVRISGPSIQRTRARRATRRSRRSTSRTSARLRVAWRHKQADPAILAANPDFALIQPLHGHADLRRRAAVRAERLRACGGHRSEDRPHGVDAEAADRRARRAAVTDDQQGRRVLGQWQRRAHLARSPAAPVRAEPEDRRARRGLRRRRQGRSLDGGLPLQVERRARRRRRRRRARLVDARAGLRRLQGRAARLRARVRRAHGQGALDVEPRAARGRSRDGDLG